MFVSVHLNVGVCARCVLVGQKKAPDSVEVKL